MPGEHVGPVRETYTLEFASEEDRRDFSLAIRNCGGEYQWAYVLAPTPHKVLGWRNPNVHHVFLRPVQED